MAVPASAGGESVPGLSRLDQPGAMRATSDIMRVPSDWKPTARPVRQGRGRVQSMPRKAKEAPDRSRDGARLRVRRARLRCARLLAPPAASALPSQAA